MAFSDDEVLIMGALTPISGHSRMSYVLSEFSLNVLGALVKVPNLFPNAQTYADLINPNLDTVKASLRRARTSFTLECKMVNPVTGVAETTTDLIKRDYNSVSIIPYIVTSLNRGFEVHFSFIFKC